MGARRGAGRDGTGSGEARKQGPKCRAQTAVSPSPSNHVCKSTTLTAVFALLRSPPRSVLFPESAIVSRGLPCYPKHSAGGPLSAIRRWSRWTSNSVQSPHWSWPGVAERCTCYLSAAQLPLSCRSAAAQLLLARDAARRHLAGSGRAGHGGWTAFKREFPLLKILATFLMFYSGLVDIKSSWQRMSYLIAPFMFELYSSFVIAYAFCILKYYRPQKRGSRSAAVLNSTP